MERMNLQEDIRKLRSKQKMYSAIGKTEEADKCSKKAERLEAKLKLIEVTK